MQKIIKDIKKGIFQGVGIVFVLSFFVFGFYLVKGWNGLQATDGDTLTAAKWNELVSKVNGDITCPTGFTKIESQGRIHGCIQNDIKGTSTFMNAVKDCYNTYGGQLPTYSQLYNSILNYDLSNEGTNYEWIDQADYGTTNGGALLGNNDFRPTYGIYTNLFAYRCFIPAYLF